ncbi:DUF6056 family protein [Dysgonomonas sp. 25]|uniref:DUF3329 domain-containing protein n=1 Tax=Dysgonomonas sp. 25 TaxID=2302933 RepID=UPI0013CFABA6|nr:DUF6056 family protein [Dysgonomonas sp. 25]NDV69516.1 hypothetical protein [Dysgonomonas sp. 25]
MQNIRTKNNLAIDKPKLLLLAVILVAFALIYILNKLYPLFGEDWDYAFFWIPTNDHPDRIGGIIDVIRSQYNHYLYWGGRNVAHGIIQYLMYLGEGWSDFLNTLVFIGLCYTIYRIANIGKQANARLFVIVFLALWFLQIMFVVDVLWLTLSCNYMWTTFIILAFSYRYYAYYKTGKTKSNILLAVFYFLFGIAAGWTNEHMGVALLFFLVVILYLIRFVNKDKLPAWAIAGLIGTFVGYLILFTAPGNYVRMGGESNLWNFFTVAGFKIAIISLGKNILWGLSVPTLLYIIFLYLFKKKNVAKDKRKVLYTSHLFLLTSYVSIAALLFAPGAARHVLFGSTVFAIIGVVILYANIDFGTQIRKRVNIAVLAVLLVAFGFDYYRKYAYLDYVHDFWANRLEIVEQEKAKGNKDVIFYDFLERDYYYGTTDMYYCADCWMNRVYARYYGLNSVLVMPPSR